MSPTQRLQLARHLDALFAQLSRAAGVGQADWSRRDVRAAFDAAWETSVTAMRIADTIDALARDELHDKVARKT